MFLAKREYYLEEDFFGGLTKPYPLFVHHQSKAQAVKDHSLTKNHDSNYN